MTPIKYIGNEDICTFHYKYSDLKAFIQQGKLTGDVGMIIISKSGNIVKYKGFGVICNPCKTIISMGMVRFEPFSGKFSIDAIMNPKPMFEPGDLKFIILDMSKKII